MNDSEQIINWGRVVLKNEASALEHLHDILDQSFVDAVEMIFHCEGKLVISGMGKSGHIGKKIAATLSSTGTPTVFFNPAEGGHGDLGVVVEKDIVILISKSGETGEISLLLPFIKRIGARIVSITNSHESSLAKAADVSLRIDIGDEACPIKLAPTTSTTATLALGDALAVALMKKRNFQPENFALFHPSGSLGRQLLKVEDVMETTDLALVKRKTIIREVLHTILDRRNRGVAIVVEDDGTLAGIIVDGDLKRLLLQHEHLLDVAVEDVMTTGPKTISRTAFVGEALKMMEGRITSLLIVNEKNRPEGLIHIHDILEARAI